MPGGVRPPFFLEDKKMTMRALLPDLVLATTPLWMGASLFNPELRTELASLIRARVVRDGKFTKLMAMYMPISLMPPGAWFYECSTCPFFQAAAESCEVVEGSVQAYAWCPLWVSRPEDSPFSWIARAVG
ncbi:hypothetical protein LCGC14_0833070 [marine sediment metagenome]|uniref:Uncharacterized protein n=1 Tax=marine sediment metagenome TaxID=412755 RepID=A0A0F9KMG6_9ZZZZ